MKTTINVRCPQGTYGLAVEPWSRGEIYAVAANWAQASATIYAYGKRGWHLTGRQVADYRHSPEAALRAEVIEAIASSEAIPSEDVDDDEVDHIIRNASKIG